MWLDLGFDAQSFIRRYGNFKWSLCNNFPVLKAVQTNQLFIYLLKFLKPKYALFCGLFCVGNITGGSNGVVSNR